MTRLWSLALATAALTSPALAQTTELPAPFQARVDAATAECAAFEDGTFALDWGAVVRADLDGDLQPDWVLDEFGFRCSSAASLYCGNGGCAAHFLVGESLSTIVTRGWDLAQLGPQRVLLVDVHGSDCGGIGPTPCVVSSVWDAEEATWRSATARWD